MLLLVVTILLLLVINLVYGSVHIPFRQVTAILAGQPCERESWRFIVVESRLPQAVTACLRVGLWLFAVCFFKQLSATLLPIRLFSASTAEPAWEWHW